MRGVLQSCASSALFVVLPLAVMAFLTGACGDAGGGAGSETETPSTEAEGGSADPGSAAGAPAAEAPPPTAAEAGIFELEAEEGAQAVGELRTALENTELASDIRIWVARQIAVVPGSEAAQALADALDTEPEEVRHAVVDALVARKGDEVVAVLESAAAHPDPYVMRKIRERLGE